MPRKKKIAEDAKVSEVPETPVETPVSEEPKVPQAPSPAPEPPKPEAAPVGGWPRLPPWLLPTVKDELDDPFGMVGFID